MGKSAKAFPWFTVPFATRLVSQLCPGMQLGSSGRFSFVSLSVASGLVCLHRLW